MFVCARARPAEVADVDRLATLSGLHVDAATALRLAHVKLWVARDPTDSVVGFLMASQAGDTLELTDLATSEAQRRRGVATALLETLIVEARTLGLRQIFLEVRSSNQAAQALYRKHAFEVVGTRQNYYRNPVETALCLRLGVEPAAAGARPVTP